MNDLKFAFRQLLKNPGFTAVAVLTLALGIGGSTAVFSIINAVLLRPLPYREPERLVQVWTELSEKGSRRERSSYANFADWKRQSSAFEALAIYDPLSCLLTGPEQSERVTAVRTSANLFSLFGVSPFLGRTFSAEEATQRARVVVLSHGFWQRHFAGASDIVGRTVEINGQRSEIIGVMPEHFESSSDVAFWEPHTLFPNWTERAEERGIGAWFVLGRLKRDQTLDQAQAEMRSIAARLARAYPADNRGLSVRLVSLKEASAGPNLRLAVWILFGAVISVLLIGCANLINLLLVRGVTRRRELATRLALGASLARLIRQLVVESLPIGLLGGTAGVFLAILIVRVVQTLTGTRIPRLAEANLDPLVVGFALGLTVLASLVFGIIPGMQARRLEVNASLKEGERATGGSRQTSLRHALVISELALASLLLFGAGLLIRSFQSVRAVDPGFASERVLYTGIRFPESRSAEEATPFYEELSRRLERLPGVQAVGLIEDVFGGGNVGDGITIEARPTESGQAELTQMRRDSISPAWFRTAGVSLLQGRSFNDDDRANSLPVAIINESMALRFWPGQSPVGKRFKFGPRESRSSWLTVVGVVPDMRRENLERRAIPQVFYPVAQNPSRHMELLVKTASDPLSLAEAVRQEIRSLDKQVAVSGISTLDKRLGASLLERRFQTSLLSAFSLVALVLAGIGTYGIVHYSVRQRTREIAIRMVLGAQRPTVLWSVLRQGMTPGLIGISLGAALGLLTTRLMQRLLFEVQPTDPLTLVVVSFLLAAVALLACWWPARRATKVDPMVALRYE